MLRKMVGWVRYDDESWENTGHRMKHRLEVALGLFPLSAWSQVREEALARLLDSAASGAAPRIVAHAISWQPAGYRTRGRPLQRL